MANHDAVWAALSHPARRRIVDELRQQPVTTGELHVRLEEVGLAPSRFATQRHLQALREADLVLVDERGRERINALNGSMLYQATIGWLDPHGARIAHDLDRLKLMAEGDTPESIYQTNNKEATVPTIEHLLVEQGIDIAAPSDRVWQLITGETDVWWQPPFTLLPDAHPGSVRLELPNAVGDPVIERDGERSAVWGQLIELVPNHELAFSSRVCGADAATGTVRFSVESKSEGTRLEFRQEAIGVFSDGMHDAVTRGWQDKLQRIQGHLTHTE